MEISFHTDPVRIIDICADLKVHEAVFIDTTRTNFREIAEKVEANGAKVLLLAAKDRYGDFHNFLLRYQNNDYQVNVTEALVLKAILAWQRASRPIPHLERV